MKKIEYTLWLLLFCLILTGCSKTAGSDSEEKSDGGIEEAVAVDTAYKVFYLSQDKLSIVGETYTFTSATVEERIDECIKQLMAEPGDSDLITTIPSGVEVSKKEYNNVNKQVDIHFTEAYIDIPKNEEILVRAAVVKTLTQFDGLIDYVQFFIGDEAMKEADGRNMIMMNSDFVENTKADIKYLNQETIKLYFASSDGTLLVEEDVYVHYYKTVSVETVIVESIISGPISKTLNSTVSSDTKLNKTVNVVDGICYVDFNQRFLDKINEQDFKINVYSVVNSLIERDNIDQVQILIDGQVVEGNDTSVSLGKPLTKNENLILKTTDDPAVVEEEPDDESLESVHETAK